MSNKVSVLTLYYCEDCKDWYVNNAEDQKGIISLMPIAKPLPSNPTMTQYKIKVVYHDMAVFDDHENEDTTSNDNREDRFAQNELKMSDSDNMIPIIHIIPIDIFDDDIRKQFGHCPRYFQIMDNSIWNKVVVVNTEENTINSFKDAIKAIVRNYKCNLYDLDVSQEYADLNSRLVSQAYINKKAHGKFVSPFLFHSEKRMHDKALALLDTEIGGISLRQIIKNNKWRILLIDDYVNNELKEKTRTSIDWPVECQEKELCQTGKLNIIINDIKLASQQSVVWCCPSQFTLERIIHLKSLDCQWHTTNVDNRKSNISIFCVRDIESAIKILQFAKFDIVLLDYLLGTISDNNKKRREYSYELLCKIKKTAEKGPTNSNEYDQHPGLRQYSKYYFMHISSFVTAISERLEELGLIRDTQYWHIARGACPTNTPYLFLYYLYRLMEKRYNEMSLGTESGMSGHTLVDFLNNIFDDDFKKVKYRASKYFNTLLNLRNKYDIMKHDVYEEDSNLDWLHKRGSLLVYSLFPDIKCYSNAFWEHMQQLIYLVAFGTVRQWPEMWEEYVFVRDRLKEAEQKVQTVNNCPFRKVRLLSDKIEDYIIQLRNR